MLICDNALSTVFRWDGATDKVTEEAFDPPLEHPYAVDILPGDFCPQKFRRAIGGIQIARGEVVRRVGYCKDSRRQEWRCPHWVKPSDDIHFRRGDLGDGLGSMVRDVDPDHPAEQRSFSIWELHAIS